jgi:hypothetical protein
MKQRIGMRGEGTGGERPRFLADRPAPGMIREELAEYFEAKAALVASHWRDRYGVDPRRSNADGSLDTDSPPTGEDIEEANALAWSMGTLFSERERETFSRDGMSSVDEWALVVRALRIAGLELKAQPGGET